MDLLISPEDRGYPVEYILARIRGRRTHLISDWRSLVFEPVLTEYMATDRYSGFAVDRSPENIWKELMKEFRWVYLRMDRGLRKMFGPFFLYSELRTVFICLRQVRDKRVGRAEELLRVSLLSDEVKNILRKAEDIPSAVSGLERLFCDFSGRFSGLGGIFDSAGLAGVERRITDVFLACILSSDLSPLIRDFFLSIIDSRNIISLYKYIRLEITSERSFIPGGRIPEARLKGIMDKNDPFGVLQLVRESSGIAVEKPSPVSIENTLYRGISHHLRTAGRDPLGKGLILDYLWRCSMEAMNLGILYYGRDLDRETVAGELVQ